jgi:hypothetical protein
MKSFNADEEFELLLAGIKNGDIKTTHHLRRNLESLSEQFNIKALLILVMFREWLAKRNIDLLTENGVVEIKFR